MAQGEVHAKAAVLVGRLEDHESALEQSELERRLERRHGVVGATATVGRQVDVLERSRGGPVEIVEFLMLPKAQIQLRAKGGCTG